MKRKLLASLLLIALFMLPVFSTDTGVTSISRTLPITAYRLGEQAYTGGFINLKVVKATYLDLGFLHNDQEANSIEIKPEIVSSLLANEDSFSGSPTGNFGEHVLFSYLITGNQIGNYNVSITFKGPFIRGNTSSATRSDDDYIDLAWSLRNISYSFVDNKNHPGNSFTVNEEGGTYTYAIASTTAASAPMRGYTSSTAGSINISNETLTESFSFSRTSSSATVVGDNFSEFQQVGNSYYLTNDSWSARGVIGISISGIDYTKATAGTYSTTATVTVKVVE